MEKPTENAPKVVESLIISSIKKSIKNSKKTTVSIALSSGIDSTLMLALLKKTCPDVKINAISIKFANSVDESKDAAKIASKFDVDHHIVFVENYLEELPTAISVIKKPFWDLHWYHVVKKAKTLGKTLVSGDGGDELFGGYTFRYEKFLSLITKNSTPLEKTKAYLECHERDWVPDQDKLFGKQLRFSWHEVYRRILPFFDNHLSSLLQVFLADFNGKLLYNWIPLNSSIHKHFGVKSVAPLLSKETIQYATHIPINLKYDLRAGVGKLVLRQILKKHSLEQLLIKKKQGFSVDTISLWNSYGYDLCDYYLSDSRIVQQKWIDKLWIDKHFRRDLNVRYINKFLGLLAFEAWYRIFITKEMKATTTLS
ncbi:MAG: asparagine synthase C-terminal domain-containing protein [Candidatus Nitrosotenuis sp.]